jgi:hypothetical protein
MGGPHMMMMIQHNTFSCCCYPVSRAYGHFARGDAPGSHCYYNLVFKLVSELPTHLTYHILVLVVVVVVLCWITRGRR